MFPPVLFFSKTYVLLPVFLIEFICKIGSRRSSRYSWNTANVGAKHQSINQSINSSSLLRTWYNIAQLALDNKPLTICFDFWRKPWKRVVPNKMDSYVLLYILYIYLFRTNPLQRVTCKCVYHKYVRYTNIISKINT